MKVLFSVYFTSGSDCLDLDSDGYFSNSFTYTIYFVFVTRRCLQAFEEVDIKHYLFSL